MEKNPIIIETNPDKILEEIKRKAYFYVPEWTPGVEGDFGNALSRIFTDMAVDIRSNINHTPWKHMFSFFDKLDFSPRPAEPARTVFCFALGPGASENVKIPERTCVTAEGPKGEDIFFETEKEIEATYFKLCFVCSLNPQKDEIFDHSSIIKNKPSTLFSDSSKKNLHSDSSKKNLQEHIFYIGDKELLRTGKGKITLILEGEESVRVSDESDPFKLLADICSWEYAKAENGEETKEAENTEWVPFKKVEFSKGSGEKPITPKITLWAESIIGTGKVNGIESRWIRCLLKNSQISVPAVSDNKVKEELEKQKISELMQLCLRSVKVDVSVERIPPEVLFYNDIPLEMKEEEIQPFGSKPLLNDTFYIACSEVFGRQGSEVELNFDLVPGRASQLSEKPELSWEYWDGGSWRSLNIITSPDVEVKNFLENYVNNGDKEDNVSVKISKMPSMKSCAVNGVEDYWIRVRLIGGNFGKEYVLLKENLIEPRNFYPPKIKNMKLSYCCREGKEPEYLVSKNNLIFENKKKDLETESKFKPFEMISGFHAAYFGFTSKLVKGILSLFVKIEETCSDETTKSKWQYLSNIGETEWSELKVLLDETSGLVKSGIIQFSVPEEMKASQLYGSKDSLYWIRLIFEDEGTLLQAPLISGLYINCVSGIQARTIKDEILISRSKETEHKYEFMNRPVVDAEVWVNEVAWLPEREKVSMLEKKAQDVKAILDDKDGFSEFWVRWKKVENFYDSKAEDRHYFLDRNAGTIRFGNGIHGKIPPIGVNNIKASYRTGGGTAGNIQAFKIKKLYSDIKYIKSVYNPIASEGGSEAESPEEMLEWAPAKFKHRGQAVTEEDIGYLAREASKKVANVKVLSGLDEKGNSDPGLITVAIVPDIPEKRPTPTNEIKKIVLDHLKERASNTATLKIVGPVYRKVNVTVYTDFEIGSESKNEIKTKIEDFLHPLKGGKKGKGWDFGQFPSKLDFCSLFSHLNGISVKKIDINIEAENEASKKSPEALELHDFHELDLLCSGNIEIQAKNEASKRIT